MSGERYPRRSPIVKIVLKVRSLGKHPDVNITPDVPLESEKLYIVGGWTVQRSSLGSHYYYNIKTDVSQWEKPDEITDFERLLETVNFREDRAFRPIRRIRLARAARRVQSTPIGGSVGGNAGAHPVGGNTAAHNVGGNAAQDNKEDGQSSSTGQSNESMETSPGPSTSESRELSVCLEDIRFSEMYKVYFKE